MDFVICGKILSIIFDLIFMQILDNPTSPVPAVQSKSQPSPQPKPDQHQLYTFSGGQIVQEDEFNRNRTQNGPILNFTREKTDDKQFEDNLENIMDISSNNALLYPPTLFSSESSINVYGHH